MNKCTMYTHIKYVFKMHLHEFSSFSMRCNHEQMNMRRIHTREEKKNERINISQCVYAYVRNQRRDDEQ